MNRPKDAPGDCMHDYSELRNYADVPDKVALDDHSWTSAWLYCNNIIVNGITIISRSNGNGDGHDFDGCTNVSGNATAESENSKT